MSTIVGIAAITLVISWCVESFSTSKKMGPNGPVMGIAGFLFLLSIIVLAICFLITVFNSKVIGDSGGYLHSDN